MKGAIPKLLGVSAMCLLNACTYTTYEEFYIAEPAPSVNRSLEYRYSEIEINDAIKLFISSWESTDTRITGHFEIERHNALRLLDNRIKVTTEAKRNDLGSLTLEEFQTTYICIADYIFSCNDENTLKKSDEVLVTDLEMDDEKRRFRVPDTIDGLQTLQGNTYRRKSWLADKVQGHTGQRFSFSLELSDVELPKESIYLALPRFVVNGERRSLGSIKFEYFSGEVERWVPLQ